MHSSLMKKLEFAKILHQLKNYSQTEMAQNMALGLTPSQDLEQISRWQDEVEEALGIRQQSKGIPIPRLNESEAAFRRLAVGASLNGIELAQICKLLTTVSQVKSFFEEEAENNKNYPNLQAWVDQCVDLPGLAREIQQIVNEDGYILNSASPQLGKIRHQLTQTEQEIRNVLNQMVRSKANQLTDSLITIRNDRYVLPVKAEYRHQIPGTVHDQSSTGQTLYIEPQAVATLNNKVSQLQSDERKEIERILLEISLELSPYNEAIQENQTVIGQLDFIQAKADYARALSATKPVFSEDNLVALWQARHPLIDPDKIVANDILIGDTYRILLITGPNTGGKTVILKTFGLIQLMGQSGLFVPCEVGSQLGVFDQIFADIGDEQSIEQSLSTFSSHMTNIVKIIDQVTYQSLVLFDELGSGTDPQEGAGLAMGILDYLRKVGASVVATTHYPELKVYAHERPQTINASMEFDVDTLSPTYRLMIGVPGRSNALEISKRLGLREDIIESAREGISKESQSLNEMVAKLERERRETEVKNASADEYVRRSELLLSDLRTEYDRFVHSRDQMMEQAKIKANELIKEKQAQADKILQEIRDLQLQQGQYNTIKEHVLIDKKQSLDNLKEAENLKKNKVLKKAKENQSLEVGDDVEVLSYGQRGTILETSGKNEFLVQMGILKMKFPKEELKRIEKVKPRQKVNVQRRAGSKVTTSLDLRGQRYDAAMLKLSTYLDAALLSNHPRVTIIHGKGTGALREGVISKLKTHPQVDHFEFSPPNAGGDGSTVVYFK